MNDWISSFLKQPCATCSHVLNGEGFDCISNCGGNLSITCEADIDYENTPEKVKFVHYQHIIDLYPELTFSAPLPINCRKVRSHNNQWLYENERYEEPYVPQYSDIVCVNDEDTFKLAQKLLASDVYFFAKSDQVAFIRLYSGLQVPAIFSTKLNAENLQEQYFDQYELKKLKFEEIIEKLKGDFNFFLYDFDDGDFFSCAFIECRI